MSKCIQYLAACLLVSVLIAGSLPGTASAHVDRNSRKLLVPGGNGGGGGGGGNGNYHDRDNTFFNNLNANTVRSQAGTSQAILEAVNTDGDYSRTRRAGVAGVGLSWAAGQNNQIYNAADRVFSPTTAPTGKH